jgi:hypothetical protein
MANKIVLLQQIFEAVCQEIVAFVKHHDAVWNLRTSSSVVTPLQASHSICQASQIPQDDDIKV